MLDRRRRWAIIVGSIVVLLVLGRFGTAFLAERLWEARVSEAAALVGTRLGLIQAALELLGIATATIWFLVNLGLAARAILREFGDLPRPLGHLSERSVAWLVTGVAVVLGIAIGGGTGHWRDPVLLAAAGVRYGVRATLIDADLGTFAAGLPLLELVHERALGLVLPALLGVTAISLIGGTLRLADRRFALASRLRRQFAFLLAGLALIIAWRYGLTPYTLAATRSATLGPAEFLLRVTVSQLQLAFAVTAAALTVLWGLRVRFVVALGGWVGLGLAALAGGLLVESRASGTALGAAELATLRRVDSVAFGVSSLPAGIGAVAELRPSLWDPDALARLIETDSARVVDLVPGMVPLGGRLVRVWFALHELPGGDVSLIAVADDRAGPTGGPASVRFGDSTFFPGTVPYLTLGRAQVRPGAPPYLIGAAPAGVALSSAARRLAIAWGLQVGAVLRARPEHRIAWRLDPVDRLQRVAPFAEWSRPRARVAGREVLWLSDGFLTATRFPSSREVTWRDREVRRARVGFIGLVVARTGETRVFLRPDADSLAHAWARIAAPLVEEAAGLPAGLESEIGLPREQLAVQAQVLQGPAWLGRPIARYGRGLYPVSELPASGTANDPVAIPFLDDGGMEVAGLIMGPAQPRSLRTLVVRADSALEVAAPRELQQRWDRFPFFQQLRDSVRAAGSDYDQGLIRFWMRGDTLLAYQPSYAVGPGSRTALVLVNVALGGRLGAGRSYEEAWRNLRGEAAPAPVGADAGSWLQQAREWLERADQALRRGDLEEFGRVFGFLREILSRPGAPGSPPGPER